MTQILALQALETESDPGITCYSLFASRFWETM